ncbi:7TM diverse intracellular signaling domain-containing protein [Spirosoma panaciterrae]|uniref:7TM diverse intracellular signaling domain-containing protein n=1 Tax=Spirosoma panaciterrae TaxID=496058 RepID=UPI00035FAAA0|nr:7TM diverse intracellular signaling domain-containing protein [Spirosoma panaciterrae]
MKRLLLVLLLFISYLTHAQLIVLNEPEKTYYLHESMEALELNPEQATIDSLLLNPNKYSFVPVTQKPITPNLEKAYWFRVTLTNQINTDLFLHFLYFSNRRVVVYQVADQRVVGSQIFTGVIAQNSDNYYNIRRICPIQIPKGLTHTIYFYVEGLVSPSLHATVQSGLALDKTFQGQDLKVGLFGGFILMVIIYSLLLSLRLGDRDNLLYVIWVIMVGWINSSFYNHLASYSPWLHNLFVHSPGIALYCCVIVHQLFTISFLSLHQRSTGLYRFSLLVIAFDLLAILLFLTNNAPGVFFLLVNLIDAPYCLIVGIISYRKGFKPALYFVLGNSIFFTFALFIGTPSYSETYPATFWTYNTNYFGLFGEILFFTLGLTYKVNLLKKHQDEAIQEQLRLTKENQHLIETQNRVLEEKVEQRTAELRASQAQLIQKEKLASLGELTAGIAHEIQNPLNFVNNFSEVSAELVKEIQEERQKAPDQRDEELETELLSDLGQNLEKITHHGGRASAIVKGMLEHSRASTGEKQPTNLNALADEYLRLAYQGQRAKNKAFNCRLITEFASNLPTASVVAQDIGRVLLNLYNNAFYAIGQQARQAEAGYQPTVWVSSRKESDRIVLCVKDNGTGISEAIQEKIFQPFFTTKPTGEGTGLGLSLSYDIITKGHGGTMTIESQEGLGAQFVITLPS